VEKALRAYILARRQTRIIERLKERDLEDFKRERTKREQKTIDDQVSMRFGLQERMDGGLA
jgi:flagellar export protein FliJ